MKEESREGVGVSFLSITGAYTALKIPNESRISTAATTIDAKVVCPQMESVEKFQCFMYSYFSRIPLSKGKISTGVTNETIKNHTSIKSRTFDLEKRRSILWEDNAEQVINLF